MINLTLIDWEFSRCHVIWFFAVCFWNSSRFDVMAIRRWWRRMWVAWSGFEWCGGAAPWTGIRGGRPGDGGVAKVTWLVLAYKCTWAEFRVQSKEAQVSVDFRSSVSPADARIGIFSFPNATRLFLMTGKQTDLQIRRQRLLLPTYFLMDSPDRTLRTVSVPLIETPKK